MGRLDDCGRWVMQESGVGGCFIRIKYEPYVCAGTEPRSRPGAYRTRSQDAEGSGTICFFYALDGPRPLWGRVHGFAQMISPSLYAQK